MAEKKKNIIILVSVAILVVALIISGYCIVNNSSEKSIKYSEYDYLKDKINDYNDVYSINSGNADTSILIVEDKTNLILMITNPRQYDGGKDIALIDFTNMKIQNTAYNKNGNATMITEMNINENYIISSASTYLYSADRYRTYNQYDSEWKQIQQMALGIGQGIDAIIKGNDGKGINVFNKTIQELKSVEHI